MQAFHPILVLLLRQSSQRAEVVATLEILHQHASLPLALVSPRSHLGNVVFQLLQVRLDLLLLLLHLLPAQLVLGHSHSFLVLYQLLVVELPLLRPGALLVLDSGKAVCLLLLEDNRALLSVGERRRTVSGRLHASVLLEQLLPQFERALFTRLGLWFAVLQLGVVDLADLLLTFLVTALPLRLHKLVFHT